MSVLGVDAGVGPYALVLGHVGSVSRDLCLLIWGMQGRACRKESGDGGWGQAGELSMVGVVSREWQWCVTSRSSLTQLGCVQLCCTSSHLRHCVEDETHPLLGSVLLYVYPRWSAATMVQIIIQIPDPFTIMHQILRRPFAMSCHQLIKWELNFFHYSQLAPPETHEVKLWRVERSGMSSRQGRAHTKAIRIDANFVYESQLFCCLFRQTSPSGQLHMCLYEAHFKVTAVMPLELFQKRAKHC